MNKKQAVTSLAALAHEQRLGIFRLLVRQGPNGLAAYEIADAIAEHWRDVYLDRAGLLHASRHGRYVRYAVHIDGMRQLLEYLTEDCCQGQPELCGTVFKKAKMVCTSKGGK